MTEAVVSHIRARLNMWCRVAEWPHVVLNASYDMSDLTPTLEHQMQRQLMENNLRQLITMWALAQASPSQCAALYDCDMSTAEKLAGLTLDEVEKFAASGRALFVPVFKAHHLDFVIGDNSASTTPNSSQRAMAQAMTRGGGHN